ncbi:mitogen-activated protein kinase kinase kinase 18-like [Typha latifolia]|uniref:mitogen-activated protein kinase kinase kinase 18-like n=1 Tax=Typha latifolia TaxID=4733 RepID=UPI003C305C67
MDKRADSLSEEVNWVRGSCIGRGSFGMVSLAMYKSTGQVFAVKSINLNSSSLHSVSSLENEIKILRSLSSPYVVSYLGDDYTVGCRNLHMEYLPGGTAAELDAGSAGTDEIELRGYVRCVTRALRYLHEDAATVHCDVKGRNILIRREDNSAKLSDFGAARRVSDVAAGGNRINGTPLWMAPEVARGEHPTPASDVWSLGCTVIEMATGEHPWRDCAHGDVAGFLFRLGFGDEVPKVPTLLSKACKDFVDKCLRRDPRERWSCEQLLRHPFLAEEPSPRSVLDWATWDEDVLMDKCENSVYTYDEINSTARERLKELGSNEGIVGWDSDGWELVRWIKDPDKVDEEYANYLGVELGEWVKSENKPSCSASSCCCCSNCDCYCISELRCSNWVGISLGLLALCDLLLEMAVLNVIQLFFSTIIYFKLYHQTPFDLYYFFQMLL